VYFLLYVFVLYFVLYLYFWAPATRDRCGGRKRDGASCLGCRLGTCLCSMSNSIIYHVSCHRFVSQHTYIYHIGPHAHVDTNSDSKQQQQPRYAPRPYGVRAQGQLGWLIYPLQIKEHVPVVYEQHSFGFNRCCHI
jgi:hypothetical protein